ncbi:MAG: hypothetical protein HKN91_07245 [Acidimicrobiia bacterium]|nr:hypothetical protein [Acidimicrobiia bacterium]
MTMFSYLDAATGSMIASALAGGAAGLSVVGKTGFRRLKGKFRKDEGMPVDGGESLDPARSAS